MGLLNHLFGSTESIAREMKADDDLIIKHWNDYLKTIPAKKELVNRLSLDGDLKKDLGELKKLLTLELVDIHDEEKEETEITHDLEMIEHSEKIKKVVRLERCLAHEETKHQYVHGLLHHLYSILKSQIHLVIKLQTGSKDNEKLISHLKSQFHLEMEIVKRIKNLKTFHEMFSALVKGEHIIRTMNADEKKLIKKMQRTFYNATSEGIMYKWVRTVLSKIEEKIEEAVADGMADGYYHPDIHLEFVNSTRFVVLARNSIQEIGKRKVSENMVNVFVYLFREWYNQEYAQCD